MPLALNDKRVLPDGVHDAQIDELENLFGQTQRSTRRQKLFSKLKEYLKELQKAEIGKCLIVDGSFVMGCIDEPGDIDIILVLSDTWDMKGELRPFVYNLVSKKDIKRNYPFDVYVVKSGSTQESQWIDFFSQVNIKWYDEHGFEDGSTKGLARISL